jgi:hypothetical protein
LVELHATFGQREQGEILPLADVLAGMKLRSALTDEDVTRFRYLAAEKFHTKALCP